jgi:hypothetical protein
MWTVSLPLRCMCCRLEIECRGVHPGLVHMVQLGSKTGATLAGKIVSLSQEQFPQPRITSLSFP